MPLSGTQTNAQTYPDEDRVSLRGCGLIKTVWSITFYVSDLETAKSFYEETLGLQKKYEYASYVGFECSGTEIGLIPKLEEGEMITKDSPTVSFLVDNVEESCERLLERGIEFHEDLHEEPWGGKAASFRDPDGNMLEILQVNWGKYYKVSAEGARTDG
jgi:catechol 2,3-dioxygenase-like lactoylglutathione lyase family enzyme